MTSAILLFLAAVVAGSIAALSGFGIGSVLTPLLTPSMGTKLAVAIVSIPHFIGTAVRFSLIRKHVDKKVFLVFGVTSAIGGLIGALLHVWLRSAILGYVLGALLIFSGVAGLGGLAEKMRFGHTTGRIAGLLSGVFGGLVGNQGGIRSAALMSYDVSKESLVATATASALLVDLLRMPVYAATQWHEIISSWPAVVIAAGGVIAGTFAGKPLLERIPAKVYRMALSLLILALGAWMVLHPEG